MVSTPDPMEALKVMTDYLDNASKQQDTEDRAAYFGCAAVCSGLMAVVYELRMLRNVLEQKRA